jgi:hypothetical protein
MEQGLRRSARLAAKQKKLDELHLKEKGLRRSARLAAKQKEKEEKEETPDLWGDVSCIPEGEAHPWKFQGKKYMRSAFGEIFKADHDPYGIPVWVGMWDHKTQSIDTSVPEPVWSEGEDDEDY